MKKYVRETREDMGVLLETVREMAVEMVQIPKRLMDDILPIPSK